MIHATAQFLICMDLNLCNPKSPRFFIPSSFNLYQTPFILGYIEFKGCDTLLLTRVLGLDVTNPSLDWIDCEVKAKFVKLPQLKPTDVYFVPK